MDHSAECRAARHDDDDAQLRRVPALREMVAPGMSQRASATAIGFSQPAVSQHVNAAPVCRAFTRRSGSRRLLPSYRRIADDAGYGKLAVFGRWRTGSLGRNPISTRWPSGRGHRRSNSSDSSKVKSQLAPTVDAARPRLSQEVGGRRHRTESGQVETDLPRRDVT